MASVGKCVSDVSVFQTEYSVFTFFLSLNPKNFGSKKAMDRPQQAMFNTLWMLLSYIYILGVFYWKTL